MSLGSIAKLQAQVSEAVQEPVHQVAQYIQQQPRVHADETGWREAKKKAWLWVVVTAHVALFLIHPRRGAQVAKQLLGEKFAGILTSDRWSAYLFVDVARRQLCWAHLQRQFIGFKDFARAKWLGEALDRQCRRMFRLWHRVRDGTLDQAMFQQKMRPIERKIVALLRQGMLCPVAKVAGRCREILELEQALFTFVRHQGVEPTNNAAERALRHAVLWRKGCFGTDSYTGSRFVERILTVVTTLRLQDRNVLEWVIRACEAKQHHQPAPSLLPEPAPSASTSSGSLAA
jgi:transposase